MRGENGEPARIRTVDRLIKSEMLYQLSYGLLRTMASTRKAIGKGALPVKHCGLT